MKKTVVLFLVICSLTFSVGNLELSLRDKNEVQNTQNSDVEEVADNSDVTDSLNADSVPITRANDDEILSAIAVKKYSPEEDIKELRSLIIELQNKNETNEKRFEVLDKVIADKNQLIDELDEKVKKMEILNEEKDKLNPAGELKEEMIKYATIFAGIIAFLFFIITSILFYQNGKTRKMLEEWKEMSELNEIDDNEFDFLKN